MKAVAETLEVARSRLHEKVRRLAKPRSYYCKPDDLDLLPLVRRLADERPTYGYRRITALANRERVKAGKPTANHKRIFRLMRQNGMLLARHTGRRKGRLHDSKVIVMHSSLRWCSDGFEITCWNGDLIRLAFIIDAHDKFRRFGRISDTCNDLVCGEKVKAIHDISAELAVGSSHEKHRFKSLSMITSK